MPDRPLHLMTGSSSVRCGLRMAPRAGEPGWTLDDVTVNPAAVTCPYCLEPERAFFERIDALGTDQVRRVEAPAATELADDESEVEPCPECHRRVAYSDGRGYRHLEEPERGCFLHGPVPGELRSATR